MYVLHIGKGRGVCVCVQTMLSSNYAVDVRGGG